MAVRSKKLAAGGAGSGGAVVVYTVPANETTLLKTACLYNSSPAARTCYVAGRSGPQQIPFLFADLPSGSIKILDTWIALQPGDGIAVIPSADGVFFWLSGTELEGVAD